MENTIKPEMTSGQIILRARHLWDGIAKVPLAEGAVLVEKGMIRAVGPASEILTASDASVTDFPNGTLMPGLIDSHTHLSMDGGMENYLDHMSDSLPVLTLRATAMMRKDLAAGVTTCRCLGDREFLDVACRHSVERGEAQGPRILTATRGIRAPEGHGFVGYPFKGIDQIRKAIRENIAQGADLIKIYITGTLRGNGNLPAFLSREEIMAAIEEAHRAGKPVASHCVGGPGLDWAIEAGLDTLEHAYHITREQTERLERSNTKLVLTPGAVLSEDRVRKLPANLIEGHVNERDRMFACMALTVEARIPFAVGTDGMHGDLVNDIVYLSELGATHYEALQAATFNGARACGIEKETGTLQPGKDADIIVVNGNPLHDLRALQDIRAVMKKGTMIHLASDVNRKTHDLTYGNR